MGRKKHQRAQTEEINQTQAKGPGEGGAVGEEEEDEAAAVEVEARMLGEVETSPPCYFTLFVLKLA